MKQPSEQARVTRSDRSTQPVTGRSSFSMIELLTVVAIIIVLAGIALKVTTYVQRKTGQGQTQRVLEQVKNALGDYYTVYGSYPPGTNAAGNNVNTETEYTPSSALPAIPGSGMGYTRGLVSYLWAGSTYNPAPEAQRWQHYLTGLLYGPTLSARTGGSTGYSGMAWTNALASIHDGWDRALRYECLPPYQTYRLWSDGPNFRNDTGTVDDVGVQWTE